MTLNGSASYFPPGATFTPVATNPHATNPHAISRGLILPGVTPGHPLQEKPLDLLSMFHTEPKPRPPFQGGLLGPGQQGALWGSGKVGKSMFVLEWALRLAAGLPFLGDEPHYGPQRVLYVDRENGLHDDHVRLRALGIEPHQNLTKLSFPEKLTTLDSKEGMAWILHQVTVYQTQIVILDTVSRFIAGEEDASRTSNELYQMSILPLKARGIASLRLDHTGKQLRVKRGDETPVPMPRGSSGKVQDIDEGWAMFQPQPGTEEADGWPGNVVRLVRAVTRMGLGRDEMLVKRNGRRCPGPMGFESWAVGESSHELALLQPPAGNQHVADPDWLVAQEVADALVSFFAPNPVPYRDAIELEARKALAIHRGWKGTPSKSKVEEALRLVPADKKRTPGQRS